MTRISFKACEAALSLKLVAHRGVGGVPEEADHLGVRGWAGEGHVAIPEGAVDLEVEARLAAGVAELSQGLQSIGRQVKVEVVGPDLRSRHLKLEEKKLSQSIKSHQHAAHKDHVSLAPAGLQLGSSHNHHPKCWRDNR